MILANIGILKSKGSRTVGEQIAWIDNTETEARRMKGLVDDLLFLAKTDGAKTAVAFGRVNLSDAFLSTALALESLAFERGVRVDTDGIAREIEVLGDEAQLKRLVGILLDNAVKYSAEDSAVTLGLSQAQGKAVLTVCNLGNPLTPEDLEHLFERFYRADQSRSKEGYGLGLSIAQSIVTAHRGTISADSDPKKGTLLRAVIPLYGAAG